MQMNWKHFGWIQTLKNEVLMLFLKELYDKNEQFIGFV